tara:strand:- start:744 stop:1352 length:609 start_codon:yes stop_codon:yes gene_type:complete
MTDVYFKHPHPKGTMLVNGYSVYDKSVSRDDARVYADASLNIFYNTPVSWMGDMVSQTHIKKIVGYRYPEVNWAGQCAFKQKKLKVNFALIDIGDKDFGYNYDMLKSVIYHEMAHFWFMYNTKTDKVEQFKKEILKDKYWINFYSKRKLNKWSDELFCNEIHSILTEYKYAPVTNYTDKEQLDDRAIKTLERYMKAYDIVHK